MGAVGASVAGERALSGGVRDMRLSSVLGFPNTVLILLTGIVGIIMQFSETYLIIFGILCAVLTEIVIDIANLMQELKEL